MLSYPVITSLIVFSQLANPGRQVQRGTNLRRSSSPSAFLGLDPPDSPIKFCCRVHEQQGKQNNPRERLLPRPAVQSRRANFSPGLSGLRELPRRKSSSWSGRRAMMLRILTLTTRSLVRPVNRGRHRLTSTSDRLRQSFLRFERSRPHQGSFQIRTGCNSPLQLHLSCRVLRSRLQHGLTASPRLRSGVEGDPRHRFRRVGLVPQQNRLSASSPRLKHRLPNLSPAHISCPSIRLPEGIILVDQHLG